MQLSRSVLIPIIWAFFFPILNLKWSNNLRDILYGIGLLLGRYKQVKEYKGDIVICGVNKQIKKTLAISGIALIIDTYEEIFENLRGLVKVYE